MKQPLSSLRLASPGKRVLVLGIAAVISVIFTFGIIWVIDGVSKTTDGEKSNSNKTYYGGDAPLKDSLTQDISDLSENLRDTAQRGINHIIKAVGRDRYNQEYRIDPNRSAECTAAQKNDSECVAFLFLPPSRHGLRDTYLFARYTEDGFVVTGIPVNCLINPESCSFTITLEEAAEIMHKNDNSVEVEEIRLEDQSSITNGAHWKWRAVKPLPSDDPYCSRSKVMVVDVATGKYSESSKTSCA